MDTNNMAWVICPYKLFCWYQTTWYAQHERKELYIFREKEERERGKKPLGNKNGKNSFRFEEFYCTLLKPTSTSVPESGDLSFSVTPIKLTQDIKNLGTGLTQRNIIIKTNIVSNFVLAINNLDKKNSFNRIL